jgi:DNA invertase Pin-like site-specific DNA recombinase
MLVYAVANTPEDEKVLKKIGASTIIETESLSNWLDFADKDNMCLIVNSLNALGDNTNKVANNLLKLNEKGINFKSIKEGVDSSSDNYEQIVAVISSMQNVYINEKKSIAEQLREQKRQLGGQKHGTRTDFEFPPGWEEQYDLMSMGIKSKTQIAEYYGVSRVSIYSWIKRWEQEKRENNCTKQQN